MYLLLLIVSKYYHGFGFQLEMQPTHVLISPLGVITLWHVFKVVNTILL